MKKVLKIIGIIFIVLLVTIIALLFYLSKQPSVPSDYQKTVQTGGEIEAKYMASGTYEVSTYEEALLQGGKYILHYPSELTEKFGTIISVYHMKEPKSLPLWVVT